MNVCDHAGFHSGQGRYTAETAQLRYVLVCEDCDSELRVLESVEYRPEPRLKPAAPAS
ncbi:MAG: hypothetical protein ACXWWL_06250 [Candidatus Limnocylindria bacterium]